MLHSVVKHGSRSGCHSVGCRLHTTRIALGKNKERKADAHWDRPIYVSDRMTDRRSVFLAHASILPTSSALPTFIRYLTSLPTLKRATHCMHAYRVIEIRSDLSRILHVGQHDGGEKGSGERLSRLLEALRCENVVVVVSRWYGGVKLGSDRWKMISMVAKEAIQRGAFVKENAPDTPVSHNLRSGKRK
ncbi:ribosomal protein S5 domain 2-like protein [Phlegmacium glaucopus]|nr:ribosomal protein S5 domain 2-like protein [Phlegmacium glaucopus]